MRILVINPNSSVSITDQLNLVLAPLRMEGAVQIDCVTLKGTPPGIESQRDIDSVIDPVCDLVAAQSETADAFVIACFADTGVASAREVTRKPVVGICEAGLSTALNAGERFGVVSTSTSSRNAELRLIRSHALIDRCVGLSPVDIPVVDMLTSPLVEERLRAAAISLRQLGADSIVLGCAGMSRYRRALQTALGVPVIDPVISAVAMAVGMASQA